MSHTPTGKPAARAGFKHSCPRQELNLHPTCVGRDFKSLASTSSATGAFQHILQTKNSTREDGILYLLPVRGLPVRIF